MTSEQDSTRVDHGRRETLKTVGKVGGLGALLVGGSLGLAELDRAGRPTIAKNQAWFDLQGIPDGDDRMLARNGDTWYWMYNDPPRFEKISPEEYDEPA